MQAASVQTLHLLYLDESKNHWEILLWGLEHRHTAGWSIIMTGETGVGEKPGNTIHGTETGKQSLDFVWDSINVLWNFAMVLTHNNRMDKLIKGETQNTNQVTNQWQIGWKLTSQGTILVTTKESTNRVSSLHIFIIHYGVKSSVRQ